MISRRQVLALGSLAVAAVGLSACSHRPAVPGEDLRGEGMLLELPFEETSGVAQAAVGTSNLGWELLVRTSEVNPAIAPSTLAVTLGMLAEGATGTTLGSLDSIFGLSGDERSAALGALRQSLHGYDSLPERLDVDDPPSSPVVHQASQAVVVGDKHVEEEFLDRIAQYFDTGAQRVPLDEVKEALDVWVQEHTAGLIEESAIEVEPRLVLVLQDAILFAAAWEREFEDDDVPLDFRGPHGSQRVEALRGEFTVPFASGDGWSAVRLPYDDVLAMDVILPVEGSEPTNLSTRDLDDIRLALDDAEAAEVRVTMPPSDLTTKWDLLPALDELGIAFDDSIDKIFAGAVVDQFAQQVRLMVSAKGTVGAAVTEVAVGESAAMPSEMPELTADRPFIMRVLDTRTGWPFFLAIVTDAESASSPA